MRNASIAALAILMIMPNAGADEAADIEAGADLAKRWCAGCHLVGPDVSGGDAGDEDRRIVAIR